jgi:hypothetical protein
MALGASRARSVRKPSSRGRIDTGNAEALDASRKRGARSGCSVPRWTASSHAGGRGVLEKTDVSKPADVNGPVERTVATLISHSVNLV